MATEVETSVAVVAIKADLSHLLKEMKKVSPEAAAMTKDLVSAVNKNLKDLEKGYDKVNKQIVDKTKSAAKTAGKSWNDIAKSMQSNQMISDLEQVGSMFMLVGGNVSKMAMIFTSSIRPLAMVSEVLTQAFGPAGPALLGLAALPVVAMGAVLAIKGLADGGIEAAAHLKELGIQLGPDQTDALRSYEHAMRELDIVVSRIKVSAGEHAAPAIDRLTTALGLLATGVQASDKIFGVFPLPDAPIFEGLLLMRDRILEVSAGFLRLQNAVATVGGTEGFAWLLGTLSDATDQTIALREAAYSAAEGIAKTSKEAAAADAQLDGYRDWAAAATDAYVALGLMVPAVEEERAATDAARKAKEAAAQATREHAEEVKKMIAAVEMQTATTLANNTVYMNGVAAFRKGTDEMLKDIDAIGKGFGDFQAETDALIKRNTDQMVFYVTNRADVIRGVWEDVGVIVGDAFTLITDTIIRDAQASSDALQVLTDKDKDRIKELRENYRDMAEEGQFTSKAQQDATYAWTQAEIEAAQERIARREEDMEHQKKAAMVAYGLSQSFAGTQAIIQAAVATIGMASNLAPFIGPAAPGVAAALGAAMLATTLASIATATPPEFPMGGMTSPDHQMVATRGTEGILTDRGLRNIGGEQALDALNGGSGIGGSDGPETVALLRRIADQLTPPRGSGVQRAVKGRRT